MISDILSQAVSDLDHYLTDPEWADDYAELRDRLVQFRDEADAIRAVLDRDPTEHGSQTKLPRQTLVERMMSEETALDLWTPRFTKKDLKQRGWSDALIHELLGLPDWTEPNPHVPTAAPMCCWRQERVVAVEQSDKFRDRPARLRSRRQR